MYRGWDVNATHSHSYSLACRSPGEWQSHHICDSNNSPAGYNQPRPRLGEAQQQQKLKIEMVSSVFLSCLTWEQHLQIHLSSGLGVNWRKWSWMEDFILKSVGLAAKFPRIFFNWEITENTAGQKDQVCRLSWFKNIKIIKKNKNIKTLGNEV